jgi:hypothetical protein
MEETFVKVSFTVTDYDQDGVEINLTILGSV